MALSSICPVGSSGPASLSTWDSRCTSCVSCVHPPVLVEPWLLLACQWEGFTPRPVGWENWVLLHQRSFCAEINPLEQSLLQQGSGACWVCPLSVLLVEGVCWWCFNVVWSYPLGALAARPPGTCRPRSTTACVLSKATWHELPSHLQMAATCAGLGGAW